jgi:hypothetical protein
VNNAQRPVAAGNAATVAAASSAQPQITTRGGSEEDSQYEISQSVENKIRDKFLRQLGKMDPLNCLPKVFCEISADPNAAQGLFGSVMNPHFSQTCICI